MTKVVINTEFGGFGLSDEAFALILQRKGIEYETTPAKFTFRDDELDFYEKGHVGDENHLLWDHMFYDNRTDPDLVEVVEQLGQKANGMWAVLKIVEVPDDVEWDVTEYDGREWVAEKHRTWS